MRYLTELSEKAFLEAARNVPYQQINSDLFPGIDLWIRRDDLIDPIISGNKAYKLLFNLLEARKQGNDTIVTCGGAWSNHIHATAAAGQRFGFKTIGIIRGERPPVPSAMLQDAERFGMELRFVSRSEYRRRNEPDFVGSLGLSGNDSWFVPEGGENAQGAQGVRLLGKTIAATSPVRFDECWLACGTGLTLGALASSLPKTTKAVGVAVLKAERSIAAAIVDWGGSLPSGSNPELITGGHCGGYGKVDESLIAFLDEVGQQTGVVLDQVYTGKVTKALGELCEQGDSKMGEGRRQRVLLLHTGGLQGARGHRPRRGGEGSR
ncbi:pyridoxal-phosphate dependent enzyme [Microbulbifer salipaludis]|uniref:Pyridoxal-phosphate dependent enzyme n=1 Tax=Microbulbifer salipaludis TaxID=187980 RepID=A0ABS3E915_9GAMM|nr:pyridoxal-phosphate dependent enzyme [Microbulbifer salipaludis]MBN8431791.1 pyridoxal-phosphate dependent enzyme [Microbulbifer salipaludis]